MFGFIKKHFLIIFLVIVSLFLCFANYTPGTFLSGWDTLHPEFDFLLNFKRLFYGVFRAEQGLGAVAGHSHMVELVRLPILYVINLITGLSFVRYGFVFLTLILGPIGMYMFLSLLTKNKSVRFLGASFYLLNLGTLQLFVVPFEMFTTQFAALPWLFYLAAKYLEEGKLFSKTLIFFAITTLLASPMAYAATLWYTYFLVFVIYILTLSLTPRRSHAYNLRGRLKQTGLLLGTTLMVNAFWILPQLYFALNHGADVSNAVINKLFSPQAFFYNKEFGTPYDVALLRSFLFDWSVYVGRGQLDKLLTVWISHLSNPFISAIGIFFAVTAVVGALYAVIKKNIIVMAFLPVLFLCFLFLFNDNFPTASLYRFLQEHVPLFREALRFPHSKILGVYVFVFAVFFAYGQLFIVNMLKKIPTTTRLGFFHLFTFALLVNYMLPAFQGYLISPYLRVNIPQEYFQLFDWFNSQDDDGRVANLPIHSFWGWEYYDWHGTKEPSYQGAGFLWFGMKQPVLHRDFDRWTPQNEQYYREMSYAVYTKDPGLFAQVVQKYNVSYVLLDTSIISPESDGDILYQEEIKEMLQSLEEKGLATKDASFGENLVVYRISESVNAPMVHSIEPSTSVWPKAEVLYDDKIFEKNGTYITHLIHQEKNMVKYPFRSVSDNLGKVSPRTLALAADALRVNPQDKSATLSLPAYLEYEESIPANVVVEQAGANLRVFFYPYSQIEGAFHPPLSTSFVADGAADPLIVSVNQRSNFLISGLKQLDPQSIGTVLLNTKTPNTVSLYEEEPLGVIVPDFSTLQYDLTTCGRHRGQEVFGINIERGNNGFTLFGKDTAVCMTIPLTSLPNLSSVFTNATQEILLQAGFTYSGDLLEESCVAELATGACIGSLQGTSDYFGIQRKDLGSLGIKFRLDASGPARGFQSPFGQLFEQEKPEMKATYTGMSFIVRAPFTSTNFTDLALAQQITPLLINPAKDNIVLPIAKNTQIQRDVTTFQQLLVSCNTSLFLETKNDNKKRVAEKDGTKYVEFNSIEGSLCDSYSFSNLSKNSAYLIAITARHETGLPLTICISSSESGRCNVYAALSDNKEITTDMFLLPSSLVGNGSIDVNINNFAIRGTPTVNELYSVEAIPFPYNWLTNITEKSDSTPLKIQPAAINNLIAHNSSLYSFETQNTGGQTAFALSHSYEPGWKAYAVGSTNPFTLALPFVFGKEVGEHVLVNNWENGWILDNSTLDAKPSTLVLVYLPQYLEYVGFLLLGGTFALITLKFLRKSNSQI